MKRFNLWLADKITSGVETMWGAYIFAAIALISLPKALQSGDIIVIIAWVAQTFLQLVLLSIIMVGQKVHSANLERQITETHEAAVIELQQLKELTSEIHALLSEGKKKIKP